jgi:DNA-binding transcriptional MerR regulator
LCYPLETMSPEADDLQDAFDLILRLEQAANESSDPAVTSNLLAARDFIAGTIGPTLKPAAVSRLLGVSQTALNRWLEKGEIASVRTPEGRREVPRDEVVDLLEHLRRLRANGAARPLAAALRERRQTAEQTVDLERLLPRRVPRGHRAAELQALAYHRLVAERLDDDIANQARRRLHTWIATGRIHPKWASEWQRILSLPLARIAKEISADTPRARELRQTSPFAGVLNEHERRSLVEAVERRLAG